LLSSQAPQHTVAERKHDQLSLKCRGCSDARPCPCGGVLHWLHTENRWLCSVILCPYKYARGGAA